MAHFTDLSVWWTRGAIAVGWLERGHSYSKGDVPLEFFERLCELLIDPWTFIAQAGMHDCHFCRFSGGGVARFKNFQISGRGNGFLFVPHETTIYASPASIAHYIDSHEYRPPDQFIEAVMQCPKMRSIEYMRALLRTPAKDWIERGGPS